MQQHPAQPSNVITVAEACSNSKLHSSSNMQHQTNRNVLQSEQAFQKHQGGRMEGSVEGQQLQDGQAMAQQHMEQQHCAVATQHCSNAMMTTADRVSSFFKAEELVDSSIKHASFIYPGGQHRAAV